MEGLSAIATSEVGPYLRTVVRILRLVSCHTTKDVQTSTCVEKVVGGLVVDALDSNTIAINGHSTGDIAS